MADPASLEDHELVAAALRQKNAYALIVRRWQPRLARYLRRLLAGNAQAAEDLLQEVFIKVYLNLNDYDQTRPFAPWIYRIARNEALSAIRKRKAEPILIGGEDAALLFERIADDLAAQETFDRGRIEGDVRAAIDGLEPRYREALMLRYLEEKSYDEIADILEMPSGTVATLISRGTRQLRTALSGVKP